MFRTAGPWVEVTQFSFELYHEQIVCCHTGYNCTRANAGCYGFGASAPIGLLVYYPIQIQSHESSVEQLLLEGNSKLNRQRFNTEKIIAKFPSQFVRSYFYTRHSFLKIHIYRTKLVAFGVSIPTRAKKRNILKQTRTNMKN